MSKILVVGLSSEDRFFRKLLESAGIAEGDYVVIGHLPKKSLWNRIKEVDPLVIVTLGTEPTKMLLKKKSLKLGDIVGVPQKVSYTPNSKTIIVPLYTPEYLVRRSMVRVRECVKTLTKCRLYVEDNRG